MNLKVKLSIIVAIYNVEKELKDLLENLKPLYNNSQIEILLMNDGSTDNSWELISSIKSDNVIAINRNNGGLSYIRNEGLKVSRGEYIWFIDGDDIIDSNFVLQLLDVIDIKQPDFIHFYYQRFVSIKEVNFDSLNSSVDNDKWISQDEWFSNLINPKNVNYENYAWAHVTKKSFYVNGNGFKFFPEGRNYEDVATTYKLVKQSNKILLIPRVGYLYRNRAGSITNFYTVKNVQDLLWSVNEFVKNSKKLNFTNKIKYNFVHRYLVGAYYMTQKTNNPLLLSKEIKKMILENHFFNLTYKFKFEYILFSLNLYNLYVKFRSYIAKVLKKGK